MMNGHVHKIGDSPGGMCTIIALDIAVALSRNKWWDTLSWFNEFRQMCLQRKRPLSTKGLTTGELRKFVKFGNTRCYEAGAHQISICEFDINTLGGFKISKSASYLVAAVPAK
ncbi:hypothetical protein AM587_10010583 [Phytophthora nicotianae]|uniref:Uncharacterized protein n=1 Tax=Phytophthora nicotianae TaxID=4792 RepID=A0A0W8C1H7_PHYNI|nr:hypothetical protein AM587_10010583 [Phytophthora nicotianae]